MALRILGILAGLAEGCPWGFLPEILQYKLMNVWEEGRLYQLLGNSKHNIQNRGKGGGAEDGDTGVDRMWVRVAGDATCL